MTFLESLLLLLAIALLLLQVSRRLAIPYPTMLAAAGLVLALVPGTPAIGLDPQLSLALFIAPALLDAAYDFPLSSARSLWRPLAALAIGAVLISAAAVAGLGVALAGLPLYAAIALGAIVSPPDAAAATAVLSSVRMPSRTVTVLRGESLLNDATALLLFTGALAFHESHAVDGALGVRLGLAAPGGILLGIACGRLFLWLRRYTNGTLGGNAAEFLMTFGMWIIAERLHLSAVLCLVALGMTIGHAGNLQTPPRMRIQSFATWDTMVFVLNVLAFLLMGLQARTIVGEMSAERLREAAWFAGAVVLCVIVVRMAWVLIYNRLAWYLHIVRGAGRAATFRQGVLVGWAGMRGLVTLAGAFALPASFPQRDLIVLAAFAVVLVTLVLQGLTLAPLVRLLGLDTGDGIDGELVEGRAELARHALGALDAEQGQMAEHWRLSFEVARIAAVHPFDRSLIDEKRRVGLAAIHRQRARLEELLHEEKVSADAFLILQEELDFAEVALISEAERHIEAN